MRRFILTSNNFPGQIELLYKESILYQVKFDCELLPAAMQKIILVFSACVALDAMVTQLATYKQLTVVEEAFEISLEDFKREYPYSRNYHLLTNRWGKLTKTEQVQAYYAAVEYRKYCKRNDWYKAKIADSWLANKEFLNDWKRM